MKYCYDTDDGIFYVRQITEEEAIAQGIETFDTYEEAQKVCNELNKKAL